MSGRPRPISQNYEDSWQRFRYQPPWLAKPAVFKKQVRYIVGTRHRLHRHVGGKSFFQGDPVESVYGHALLHALHFDARCCNF